MHDSRNEQPRNTGPSGGRLVSAPSASTVVAVSGYGPAASPGIDPGRTIGSGEDMRQKLYDYLRVVIKRKWLIVAVTLSTLALGALYTLMQTPLYASTARLQIDRDAMQVVKGGDVNPVESGSIEFLRTQYELLQGRAMAERVVDALRLADDAEFLKPREFSPLRILSSGEGGDASSTKAAHTRRASAVVLANRTVRPVPGSRLVDVTFLDPSPQRAQKIANAYAEVFIASNLDKRFEANSYAKTFLDDQIKQLKLRLEESEKALLDFAEKEQIVQITEKSSTAESNLAGANAALGALISERIKNEQLWHQVEKTTAIDLPQFLTNSVVDGLRGRRNALVTEYQEKLETYKPSYPAMVQIDQKIKEIDRQLTAEVKTIKSALKAAYESSRSQEDEMKSRIDGLKAEVIELQKRMIRYNILKREVDTNRDLYNGLLQRFKEVDVAGGVGANNVFIVDKAALPTQPASPVLSRALLLSLLLGLAGGLSAAYFLERLDDRVHSPDEIERISGLPMLGVIPNFGANSTAEREIADPRSAMSEAYRSLCTALQFSTERGLPKTIVVTSSGQGEGKSITALAIARHFATVGLKVLLIDADLRLPSLHIKLGLDNSLGLSNYLTGACMPPDAMQSTSVGNLAFMASGPLPPNAADLLSGTRMHSLLSVGLEVFDLVVIDGPPMLGLADSQLLSNAAEATIFVVAAHQARAAQVRGALRRLQLARTPVIGAVMTKFDSKTAGYGYGYGQGYGYGYGYGSSPYTYGGQVPPSETLRPELASPAGHG